MSFQKLVRSQRPYSSRFIPEDDGDNGSESYYKQVFFGNPLNEEWEVKGIEDSGKDSVEEVAWRQ